LDKWSSSPLFCIVAQPLAPGGMPEAVGFELHTRGERKLIWGRAPGREISGEIPAEMKLPKLWDALRSPGNQMVDLTRAF